MIVEYTYSSFVQWILLAHVCMYVCMYAPVICVLGETLRERVANWVKESQFLPHSLRDCHE